MTAGSFAFDGTKLFDDNFQAFLEELEAVDKEMAAILRANADALAKVVRDGDRDSNARAAFNTEIAKALDALVAPPADSDAGGD